MRTTVDLPDDLFRKTKAIAALRGTTMRELITSAVEREVARPTPKPPKDPNYRVKFPLVRLKTNRKIDLTNFDFDGLLP